MRREKAKLERTFFLVFVQSSFCQVGVYTMLYERIKYCFRSLSHAIVAAKFQLTPAQGSYHDNFIRPKFPQAL